MRRGARRDRGPARRYASWTWLLGGTSAHRHTLTYSGEATLCLLEWEAAGKAAASAPSSPQKIPARLPLAVQSTLPTRAPFIPPNARRRPPSGADNTAPPGAKRSRVFSGGSPPVLPQTLKLDIVATDPVRLLTELADTAVHRPSILRAHITHLPPTELCRPRRGPAAANRRAAVGHYHLLVCAAPAHRGERAVGAPRRAEPARDVARHCCAAQEARGRSWARRG